MGATSYYDLDDRRQPQPMPDQRHQGALIYWRRWEKLKTPGTAEYNRYTVCDKTVGNKRVWAFFDGFNRYLSTPPLVWTVVVFVNGRCSFDEQYPTEEALLARVKELAPSEEKAR